MQPKIHWSVCGNAFAAAIDRQKTPISRIRNEACAGETFSSAAIFSAPTEPASPENIIREQGSKQNIYTQIEREQKQRGWNSNHIDQDPKK